MTRGRRSARLIESRARSAAQLLTAAAAPGPAKRARLCSPEPQTEPVRKVSPSARLVCSGPGLWSAPATVFLDDDLTSMRWTPAKSKQIPKTGGTSKLSGRAGCFAVRRKQMYEDVHSYFVSRKAANDSARGIVRMFRHIGRITLAGVLLTAPLQRENILVSDEVPDACNLTNVLEILHCDNEKSSKCLDCLLRLATHSASPWDTPLLLAVCSKAHVKSLRKDATKTLQVDILAGRLLFELLANNDMCVLFQNLDVCIQPSELATRPTYPAMFARSPPCGNEDSFSFNALLRRAESLGFRDLDDKPCRAIEQGLRVSLLPFQRQTVQFMLDRENDTRGINDYFWKTYAFTPTSTADASSAGSFYYFPLAGELRLHQPPFVKGALICEEMGLGKTIEAISVILAQRCELQPFEFMVRRDQLDCKVREDGSVSIPVLRAINQDRSPQKDPFMRHGDVVLDYVPHHMSASPHPEGDVFRVQRWPARSTLVVVPVSLLRQWNAEVLQKAPDLSVVEWVWSGPDRTSEEVCVGPNAKDVVLASYESLRYDPRLGKIHWKRLIVDEAQVMRRSMTQVARDALSLRSDARFLMTGTPITNSLNDISGELAFLKIWPFTLENDGFWESRIFLPWQKRESSFLLDTLLQHSMMRHTKSQPGTGIRLPPRSYTTIRVRLTGSHRAVYCFLWGCIVDELDRLDTHVRPDMRSVRSLFNLMRTTCVSASLVNTFALDFARRMVWASRMPETFGVSDSSADDEGTESGIDFRIVNPAEALEFIGAAGTKFNRDTNRSFAMKDDENELARYGNMDTSALREEMVARGISSRDTLRHHSRSRLIVLLAGGVHRLDTDTLSELRIQVRDAGLVSLGEVSNLSRERAIGLLRTHFALMKGINVAQSINESGFAALNKLTEGRAMPSCPVCIGACERPALTRCGHFYCRGCISLMIQTTKSMHSTTRCAICRRGVDCESIVEVLVPKSQGDVVRSRKDHNFQDVDYNVDADGSYLNNLSDTGDLDDDSERNENQVSRIENTRQSPDLNAVLEKVGNNIDLHAVVVENGERSQVVEEGNECRTSMPSESDDEQRPLFSRQDVPEVGPWEEYDGIGPAPPRYRFLGRNPLTPSLDPLFLQHLRAAQDSPPKLEALLRIVLSARDDSKFVVVAEAACTLRMIGLWLEDRGVGCVGVGMESSSFPGRRLSRDAAHEFRVNPLKRVFLLNTASSSGLTLTVAEYVVFMEPLANKADEIQASARVHRIGQSRPVQIIRIVASNTVEDDILQFRGGCATTEEEAAALSGTSRIRSTSNLILSIFGRRSQGGRDIDSTDGDYMSD